MVCYVCDDYEGSNEHGCVGNNHDYDGEGICELANSNSMKSKALRPCPNTTSHIPLIFYSQKHILLYRFLCSKFVELYIFSGDGIHLPLLPLEKEASQLELMV